MTDSKTVVWQRVDVAAGVSVELPPGAVTSGAYQGVTYAWQSGAAGKYGMNVGAGRDLASWRAVFQAVPTLGAETHVTVCGRPALRQEATFAAGAYAIGSTKAADGTIVHGATEHAAMTQVAVAFTTATGTSAVASWEIETAARGLHEADATRFFASITCT